YYATFCGVLAHSTCMTMLKDEFKAEVGALSASGSFPMVFPKPMHNAEILFSGPVIPYDQSTAASSTLNTDHSYAAMVALGRLPGTFGSALEFETVTPVLTPTPTESEWESHGSSISTGGCAEYVYKKYWGYNRFEDAASSCKHD